jgi:predicted DCC family thiol-disulfide oxidoreductase YuxK
MNMTTLFQNLLGPGFDLLPEPVRRLHMLDRELFTGGRADVTAPRFSIGAALLSLVAGLPAPGRNVEAYVRFSPLSGGREFWRRDFAGRRYRSVMEAAKDGRLIEHFGPFDLYFDLAATRGGLRWRLSEWRFLKIPLPSLTTPRIDCFEGADGDRFTFDIDVQFPIVGTVVHYRGALVETPSAAPVWVYDGVCLFCDSSVRYALAQEITPSFRFVAIQCDEGRRLARENNVDPDNPDTFLFIENGRVMMKSEALFAVARQLRGPARFAFLAQILPRAVADALYGVIARNRYRWFGRKTECAAPDPAQRHRFVLPGAGSQLANPR